MSSSDSSVRSPLIVSGIVAMLVVATPLMTFQDDQLPLGMTLLLVGFALVIWMLRPYPWPRRAGWILLGGLAVSMMSLVTTELRYVTGVALAWLWAGIFLFLLFQSWFATRLRPSYLIGLLAAWSCLLIVPGWWLFITLWQRAMGFLYNANGFGGAMVWAVCVAAVLVAAGWHRRWTVPVLLVIGATFLITVSLTAMVALVVPLAILGWWYRREIRWRYLLFSGALVLATVAFIWGAWRPPQLINFMSTGHFSISYTQRLEFNRVAFRMWQAKPLTGWGLGTYKQTFPRYTQQFNEQPLYAHNIFSQAFAETGVVGGLGWLLIVVAIGRAGWVATRQAGAGTESIVMRGLFLGWLAFTIHAALDFSWHFPAGQIWWLLSSAVFLARWRPNWIGSRRPAVSLFAAGMFGLVCIGVAMLVLSAITPTNRGLRAVNESLDAVALEQYHRAYRLTANPDTAAALAGVYWLRRQGNDLTDAEQLLRSALAANQGDYFLHSALGHNLVAQHRLTDATSAFAKATELDPYFHPEFFYNYVVALKNDGHRDEAADVLRRALSRYGSVTTPNPIILRQLPLLQQLQVELIPATD